jgi:hypothetical protein
MHQFDDDDGDRSGEEYAQMDGDEGPQPVANFVPNTALPWLRNPQPPWHMWGNTQVIDLVSTGALANPAFNSGQLCKVGYGRPDTWHWVFSAKILNAEAAVAPSLAAVFVAFDLIIGVGRSNIQLPDFEQFVINYPAAAPLTPFYSTQVIGPNRTLTPGPGGPVANIISEIAAQDIQVQVRTAFFHSAPGAQAKIEVSAHFAPKNHTRPDWYRTGPEEVAFPGAEIEGR